MDAVLRGPRRGTSQEIAGDDEIGISTADATRTLRSNLAGAHVANLATDTAEAKRTLRLLLVKAIKHRIMAELLQAKHHLAHGGIGRLLQDILFRGKGLAVLSDGFHIILDAAMLMGMLGIMIMRMPVGMFMNGIVSMRMIVWVLVVMVR